MRKKSYETPEFDLISLLLKTTICSSDDNPEVPVKEVGDDEVITD